MTTIGTMVNAAASGMLPAVPWNWYTAWPMKGRELPTIPGMM